MSTCKSGPDAIAQIATRDLDFVIVDLDTPSMRGDECVRLLRSDEVHLVSKDAKDVSSVIKRTSHDRYACMYVSIVLLHVNRLL